MVSNLVFDAEHYFVYDAWNRVVAVHEPGMLQVEAGELSGQPGDLVARYEYDALGRRVVSRTDFQSVSATRHVYGGGPEVLAEYLTTNGQETLERWIVHGQSFPDPLLMVDLTSQGLNYAPDQAEVLYYIKDALGSVVALTNENGVIAERYFYTPYGETTVMSPISLIMVHQDPPRPAHWHDHDLDGDIDQADEDSLMACANAAGQDGGLSGAMCAFSHDVDKDGRVEIDDLAHFAGFQSYDSNGSEPPSEWVKFFTPYFDADTDGDVDFYDFSGMQDCANSNGPPTPACLFVYDREPASSFPDGYIDDLDLAAFFEVYTGPDALTYSPIAQSAFGNPLMWTGQRYDAATGFYAFWARLFGPKWAKFNQRDALSLLATADISLSSAGPTIIPPVTGPGDEYPDGLNLYSYVTSNPTNLTDPFGLDVWDEDVDDTIAGLFAERAGAAHHALERIGYMAQRTAIIALQIGISAIVPGAGIYFSAEGLAASLEDMFYNGITWGNAASSTLNAFGFGGSVSALPAQAGAFAGRLSRSLGRIKGAYAGAGGAVGQWHHAISKKIWKALQKNPATRGKYQSRDERFKTQGKDSNSHRGYQHWHRDLDDHFANWIRTHRPTPQEFEALLRNVYNSPQMLERFPNGL